MKFDVFFNYLHIGRHLGRHLRFWRKQADVITPPDGFSKYRPRAIGKCKQNSCPPKMKGSVALPIHSKTFSKFVKFQEIGKGA